MSGNFTLLLGSRKPSVESTFCESSWLWVTFSGSNFSVTLFVGGLSSSTVKFFFFLILILTFFFLISFAESFEFDSLSDDDLLKLSSCSSFICHWSRSLLVFFFEALNFLITLIYGSMYIFGPIDADD
jgi:hypothetical protein